MRVAGIVVTVPRGGTGRVALHGVTFVVIEAWNLGLASLSAPNAIRALDRRNEQHGAIGGLSSKGGW